MIQKNIIIGTLPLLYVLWGIYVITISEPFFNSFPDPEYAYLMNGVNVARGKFNDIGHLDHPGTPFQLYCGAVIKIVHSFSGSGSIAHDVLGKRPEFYLRSIQLSLVFFHSILAYFIGWIALRRSLPGWISIFLQSSLLMGLWLYTRVNQERGLFTASLLFTLIYLAFGYRNRSPEKFALFSGIVMAMGFATKFNYLPILLLPVLLTKTVKHTIIYLISLCLSYYFWIFPIRKNFHYHLEFLERIATHEGKYGSGEERMFNPEIFKNNLLEIFKLNPEIFILIVSALIVLIISFRNKRKSGSFSEIFKMAGIILIATASLVMVAKHYSYNYLIPIVSLYTLLLFLIFISLKSFTIQRLANYFLVIFGSLFLILAIFQVEEFSDFNSIERNREIRKEVASITSDTTLWLPTEPLWARAPYLESALTYGVSYTFNPKAYVDELSQINPNVYVLNSIGTSFEQWRGPGIETEVLFKMNKPMHLFATPIHDHSRILAFLGEAAANSGFELVVDTSYSSPDGIEHILQVRSVFIQQDTLTQ